MKKVQKNKGITLISLVVTIIILIILAAIAINLLLGDNGIIKRAIEGAGNWRVAQQEELDALNNIFPDDKKEILVDVDIGTEYPDVLEWIPIYTKEQLAKVGSNEMVTIEQEDSRQYTFAIDAAYMLKNDIDLSGNSWIPLTLDLQDPFKGIFFGNNKIIKNMTITEGTGSIESSLGLFSCFSGIISNLGLENVNINLATQGDIHAVGGLAGRLIVIDSDKNVEIKNCYVTGEIVARNISLVGGFVGHVYSYSLIPKAIFNNLLNNTNIDSSFERGTGGIMAGGNYSTVQMTKCYNKGNISAGEQYAGGLIGIGESLIATIEECYNTGNISGDGITGGITGMIYR